MTIVLEKWTAKQGQIWLELCIHANHKFKLVYSNDWIKVFDLDSMKKWKQMRFTLIYFGQSCYETMGNLALRIPRGLVTHNSKLAHNGLASIILHLNVRLVYTKALHAFHTSCAEFLPLDKNPRTSGRMYLRHKTR